MVKAINAIYTDERFAEIETTKKESGKSWADFIFEAAKEYQTKLNQINDSKNS